MVDLHLFLGKTMLSGREYDRRIAAAAGQGGEAVTHAGGSVAGYSVVSMGTEDESPSAPLKSAGCAEMRGKDRMSGSMPGRKPRSETGLGTVSFHPPRFLSRFLAALVSSSWGDPSS